MRKISNEEMRNAFTAAAPSSSKAGSPTKRTTRAKREGNNRATARDLLLAAARVEFSSKGYEGARIDEIAARAGVNKQIIYYHFGNKDDLFRVTLEHIYTGIKSQNEEFVSTVSTMPPDTAIRNLIAHFFGRLRDHQDVIALVLEENRHKGHHLVDKKLIHSSHVPMFDYVAGVLAEGQRSGMFARKVDPRQFFFDLISLCMFYFISPYTMTAVLKIKLLSKEAMEARKEHIASQLIASLGSR